MLNEYIFFIHIACVAGFSLLALKIGKEALISTICLYSILSNLFVTKQITLFGFSVVNTDVFAVGGIFGLNMLQEFFGREIVKKTIAINFLVTLAYLAMSQIHLWYVPNMFDVTQSHFDILLSPMPRIIIASVIVYVVVQMIDACLYGYFKSLFHNKHLVTRNLLSLCITHFIDTVLFSIAALYGTVHSVIDIIIVSYCVKIIVILCNAPFITITKKIMRSLQNNNPL